MDLNISHNKIDRLPRSEIWDLSHLCQLNLKHNRLGAGDEKKEKLLLYVGVGYLIDPDKEIL